MYHVLPLLVEGESIYEFVGFLAINNFCVILRTYQSIYPTISTYAFAFSKELTQDDASMHMQLLHLDRGKQCCVGG